MLMTIFKKIRGEKIYLYDVVWDKEQKRQVWIYKGLEKDIGTTIGTDIGMTIGTLTDDEKAELKRMLVWISTRKHRQSGVGFHEIAQNLLEKFGLRG